MRKLKRRSSLSRVVRQLTFMARTNYEWRAPFTVIYERRRGQGG